MLIDRATPRPNDCYEKRGCNNDIRLTPWVSSVFVFPLDLDATLKSERLIDLKADKEVKKIKWIYLRREINSYN